MPLVYTHVRADGAPPFECTLRCRGCEATVADAAGRPRPCSRRVCVALPYCAQHLATVLGVRVGPSEVLPGTDGLYVTRAVRAGAMLAPYGGEVLTTAEIGRRYGVGPRALAPYTMQRVDAACERYVGAMANGAFGAVPRARANARAQATARAYAAASPRPRGATHAGYRLTRANLGIKFWLVASRDLRAGEEVVLDYGRDGYAAAFRARARACGAECDRTRRTTQDGRRRRSRSGGRHEKKNRRALL